MKKLFIALSLILGLTSCASKIDVDQKYIITPAELKEMAQSKKTTFVLFWTDWCSGSKTTCNNTYIPLAEQFLKEHSDMQVIIIGADQNISLETIESHRAKGIQSFYLETPGNNGFVNRREIKAFAEEAFPDVVFPQMEDMMFAIPVRFMINENLEVLNDIEAQQKAISELL